MVVVYTSSKVDIFVFADCIFEKSQTVQIINWGLNIKTVTSYSGIVFAAYALMKLFSTSRCLPHYPTSKV